MKKDTKRTAHASLVNPSAHNNFATETAFANDIQLVRLVIDLKRHQHHLKFYGLILIKSN